MNAPAPTRRGAGAAQVAEGVPRRGLPALRPAPRPRGDRLLFALTLLVVGWLVLPPLGYMVWASLTPGGSFGLGGRFSWQAYARLAASPRLGSLFADTALFAFGSCLLGVAVGTAMAWLVERTNCAFRGLSYAAAFVGFALPGTLRVIGWLLLVNPRTGLINRALGWMHASWGPRASLSNLAGMIFIEGFFWAPLAFLLLVGPFRSLDASLEEAATLSGASPWRVARSVTARLLLPSLLSVALLSFVRVVQAFEVPLFIGVPAGVHVLTTQIYEGLQEATSPDYSQASAYGVLMVGLLSAILFLYLRVTREAERFQTLSGRGFRSRRTDLGPWRLAGGAFLILVFAIEVLPALEILAAAFLPSLGLTAGHGWTTENFRDLLRFPGIAASLADSLVVAAVTASAAVVLATGTSWLVARTNVPGRWLLEWLVGLPLVFPGIVMSLAVLVLYLRAPLPVYGTLWILVLAYVPTFAPYALRYVQPAILQVHRELEESAYLSGAHPGLVVRRILAPLLSPALGGAWIFICLITIRELAVASLLYTAKTPVVATQMLDMWTNGNVSQLSAFGVVVTVLSILVALPVYRFTRRFGIQA